MPKALASAPFDHEGVATRDRELVAGGVALGYVLSTYSARKLGLRTTGNAGGTHNLVVHGRGRDFDAMLAHMGRGLLVTELMGQGVNGVTGDYSRGAAGFWVEGGRIAYPVHEVTVAGNLKDIYRAIVDVGADVDLRGGIHTGLDPGRGDDARGRVTRLGLPAGRTRSRSVRPCALARSASSAIFASRVRGCHRAWLRAARIGHLVADRVEDRRNRDGVEIASRHQRIVFRR